jgi:hypothetical protein
MEGVVSSKRLPFDPESPGAQKLLRSMHSFARSRQPMDVVVISPLMRIVGERGELNGVTHKPGELLTLTKAEGEQLVAAGFVQPV